MTDLTNTAEKASAIEEDLSGQVQILNDEQREQLSKALFPTTHTDKVTVLGKERTLRPLPIKTSREINAMLSNFQQIVNSAQNSEATVDLDLLDNVMGVSKILAAFYGWEDLLVKIDEEDLMLSDLQALIVIQSRLQEMNDFLLMPLRVLVGVMQQSEIELIRVQTMFSGLGL